MDVEALYATRYAFAALKADGKVVTWGERQCGGDSSAVGPELQDVFDIAATSRAFAARCRGGVVTWGHPGAGGEPCQLLDQLEMLILLRFHSVSLVGLLQMLSDAIECHLTFNCALSFTHLNGGDAPRTAWPYRIACRAWRRSAGPATLLLPSVRMVSSWCGATAQARLPSGSRGIS